MVKVPENIEHLSEETYVSDEEFNDDPRLWQELLVDPTESPEIALPDSIYTAVILVPTAFTAKEYTCGTAKGNETWCLILQVQTLYMITFAMQVLFSYYITTIIDEQLDSDNIGDVDDNKASHSWQSCAWGKDNGTPAQWHYATDFYLRVLCVAAFAAYCIQDIFQTFWMILWVYYVPNSHGCKIKQMRVGPDQDDRDKDEVKSGLPIWHKIYIILFVLIPKLIIPVTLLVLGGQFVLGATTNEDLILNALALVFIIEIDELCYSYSLPKNMLEYLRAVPPVIPNTDCIDRFVRVTSLVGMTWNAIVLGSVTSVIYSLECTNQEESYTPEEIYNFGWRR